MSTYTCQKIEERPGKFGPIYRIQLDDNRWVSTFAPEAKDLKPGMEFEADITQDETGKHNNIVKYTFKLKGPTEIDENPFNAPVKATPKAAAAPVKEDTKGRIDFVSSAPPAFRQDADSRQRSIEQQNALNNLTMLACYTDILSEGRRQALGDVLWVRAGLPGTK
ncbi:MAG: hypothetical protein M0R49_01165 [Limnochordia bacterium]|jgi:hypothetical protein|nr:hypothetical protein [Limnochordia bacterium]